MAKGRSFTSQLFWGMLAAVALFTLGIGVWIGLMCSTGKLRMVDLKEMLLVLRGDRRYTISMRDVRELESLRAIIAEQEQVKTVEEGALDTRASAAEALRERVIIEKETYDALQAQLEREKQEIEKLIDANKALKADLDKERQRLTDETMNKQAVSEAKETDELQRTVANMDAADMGNFLETYARSNTPAAVAYLQSYMKPDFRAEVLTEMTPEARQLFLPLLANKYANVVPEKVVAEWAARPNLSPEERAAAILRMPAAQALAVYLLLDPAGRREVMPFLLPR